MKKRNVQRTVEVILGAPGVVCSKCLHIRRNEPYIRKQHEDTHYNFHTEYTCWRCCRDAESTLLIKQKWPLAFERLEHGFCYQLVWAPGIDPLLRKPFEAQKTT